ncbi:MAG: ABC transporter permease [Geminicoccaceae bacterium]
MLWQNLREALANLLGAKQRTALALIGIVIGTGSVIAMINIATIVKAEALRQFKDMGTDILMIQPRFSGSDAASIGPEDVAGLLRQASIAGVAPIASGGASLSFQGRTANGSLLATSAALADLARLRVAAGRFISDFDGYQHFCVIGSGLRTSFGSGGPEPGVGDAVRIGDYIFTIVGVLQPAAHNPMVPYSLNESIYVPLASRRRLLSRPDIGMLIARMAPGVHHLAAQREVEAYFRPRLRGEAPEIRSAEQLIEGMESQMQLYTLLLAAIGSISLIVGGVGVMNVMLVTVTERHREIGVRLAIGARQRDIRRLFLTESMLLSLFGGALGTLLGVGASAAVAHYSGWLFVLSPIAIPLGAGVSAAVGIFFGFYPAHQASRLDPITCLRAE